MQAIDSIDEIRPAKPPRQVRFLSSPPDLFKHGPSGPFAFGGCAASRSANATLRLHATSSRQNQPDSWKQIARSVLTPPSARDLPLRSFRKETQWN